MIHASIHSQSSSLAGSRLESGLDNHAADLLSQRWGHSVAHLAELGGDASTELEAVREALRTGSLSDGEAPIEHWVQDTALRTFYKNC